MELILANGHHFDSTLEVPPPLLAVLNECLATDPLKRPTLKALTNKFANFFRHENLVDSMVNRLEHYAQDLEVLVGNRTRDLVEERRKVDTLLQEMIPAYVYCWHDLNYLTEQVIV